MLEQIGHSNVDSGPRRSGTERLCALTREVKPVDALLRFVVAPDGNVVPDLKRNLPGRGLWLTATRDAVAEAVKRRLFTKGFKSDVRVRPDLADFTQALFERAVLDSLSIAGKAGRVVCGFAKTEAAIAREDIAAILHAKDGAPDGIRKLDAALNRRFDGETGGIPVISEFSSGQLDLALGRANVVHAALLAGPAGASFIARYQRMKRFRPGKTGKPDQANARRKPEGLESE